MLNLIGTYECKADVKGRIMVPAALKKQIVSFSILVYMLFLWRCELLDRLLNLLVYIRWKNEI